jgi:hypothetical protein
MCFYVCGMQNSSGVDAGGGDCDVDSTVVVSISWDMSKASYHIERRENTR